MAQEKNRISHIEVYSELFQPFPVLATTGDNVDTSGMAGPNIGHGADDGVNALARFKPGYRGYQGTAPAYTLSETGHRVNLGLGDRRDRRMDDLKFVRVAVEIGKNKTSGVTRIGDDRAASRKRRRDAPLLVGRGVRRILHTMREHSHR